MQNEMNVNDVKFEAVTRSLFKFSKESVGTTFTGIFTGTRERTVIDQETDEAKDIVDLCFEWKNELWAIPLDKGLEIALKDAQAKSGDLLMIKKLEPVKIKKGICNQYQIFRAKK